MDARHISLKNMNEADKRHKINVAYNLIKTVMEDTDEELWSYFFLENALAELDRWFEEGEDAR